VLKKKSFTLIEIIIIVIIIAILAALALPGFDVTKERTLDKEAKANLLLIQAAEKIYKMEQNVYYPDATATNVISDINANLKLSLPTVCPPACQPDCLSACLSANQVNWTYGLDNTVVASEKGMATRVGAGGRTWMILFPPGSSEIPTCTGTGCPP